jgi:hypothetical protein
VFVKLYRVGRAAEKRARLEKYQAASGGADRLIAQEVPDTVGKRAGHTKHHNHDHRGCDGLRIRGT